MKTSIYDFKSYKEYLKAWIGQQPHNGHGSKSVIAKYTQCNPAYVTQVLNGNAHFSLEQIEKLKPILALDEDEFDFFVLLVERERAGTTTLNKYFTLKIEKVLQARKQIKNRVKNEDLLSEEVQVKYYSSWLNMAVHMALTIPSFQSISSVAYQLGTSERSVKDTVDFLLKYGIIAEIKTGYRIGTKRFHLSHDSPLISKHHSNWRLQVLKSLDQKKEDNLHYSSVISISQNDYAKIRNDLLGAIENAKAIVKDSPEETLVSFCVDFFKVSVD